MARKTSQSGFSLIEALVVLAIGGMALAIIFTIGVKAGDTGFGLGRRAMAAADSDVATSDLRSIIRSVAVRPSETFLPEIDQPVIGTASRLEADVVMERATQCAPQGWAGRLVLAIETRGGEQVLTCSADGRATDLIRFAAAPAVFSYSTDGRTWASTYTDLAPGPRSFGALKSQAVWIRFAAASAVDVVEMAASGRPEAWIRRDADF